MEKKVGRNTAKQSVICGQTMSMKIYVGKMSPGTREGDLRKLFEQYGTVNSVEIVIDRESGRPRGFGFVVMETGGEEAIENLNGVELDGRALQVTPARDNHVRDGRYGGGGGHGGYHGGHGGYHRY